MGKINTTAFLLSLFISCSAKNSRLEKKEPEKKVVAGIQDIKAPLMSSIKRPKSQYLTEPNLEDPYEGLDEFIKMRKKYPEGNINDMIRPFPGSCISETVVDRRKSLPDKLTKSSDAYIYFSLVELHQHSNPLEPQELRFFNDKNFSGNSLAYTLDKQGLKKDKKLICSWNLPFSEKYLYNMSLSNCFENETGQFLGYYFLVEDQLSPGDYCKILRPEKVEIDSNGVYWVQFKIGNELFYLDTTTLPNVRNGKYILSEQVIKNREEGEKKKRGEQNKEILKKIATHPAYIKLKNCLGSSKLDCVSEFISEEYKLDIGTSGDEPICHERGINDEIKEKCLSKEFEEAILTSAKNKMLHFENLIEKNAGEFFTITKKEDGMDIIYWGNGIPNKNYTETYSIEIRNDKIIFVHYYDGQAC